MNAPFKPVQLTEVDLDGTITDVHARSGPAGPYAVTQILLRRGPHPLGTVRMRFVGGVISRATLLDAAASHPSADIPALPPLPTRGPRVTVLIATRDRPDLLDRCLRSLLRQRYEDFSVHVVDNAEDPAPSRVVVDRIAALGLDVAYQWEPIAGLTTAHNAGFAAVETEIVAFTDDDVEVDPWWAAALADAFRAPTVGCVTGLIYPASLDHWTQAAIEGTGFGKGFEPQSWSLQDPPDDPLFPYAVGRCGSGANMAFRTRTLLAIGGFDLALGAGSPGSGGDDLAAMFDVLALGDAIAYLPSAIVRHHHASEPEALARQSLGYGRGLGAFLTRCAVADPRVVLRWAGLATRITPHLIAISRRSSRAAAAPDGVPAVRGLARRHLRGLLGGPAAYRRGVRRAAKIEPYVGTGVPESDIPAGRTP